MITTSAYEPHLIEDINKVLLKNDGRYNQTKMLWPYKELCNTIHNATDFLPENSTLTTRVYYILNEITEVRRCEICGKELTKPITSLVYEPSTTCDNKECRVAAKNKHIFEKYGPDYFQQWQDKVQKTNIAKYGTSNAMFNEDVRKKQQENALAKVRKDKQSILNKRINTVVSRYGVSNVGQLPDHDYKMKATSLQRYGKISYSSTVECKIKVKEAHMKRTPEQRNHTLQKTIATRLKKYGVPFYSQTVEFIKHHRSRYLYHDISFDSSYELIYFIWNEDRNIPIERCTESFKYYYEGKTFSYIPDFIVSGEYVEIKGAHFFDEYGNLVNPFSKDEYVQQLYRKKGELMRSLGIRIITDVSSYQKDVEEKYGKDFIKSFRVKGDE